MELDQTRKDKYDSRDMRTHVKVFDEACHGFVANELDVARYCHTGRDVDLPVQHPEHALELWVVHDRERAVAHGAPHRNKEAHAGGRVGGAMCEGLDGLALRRLVWIAEIGMTLEVAGRVLIVCTVDVFGWVTSRTEDEYDHRGKHPRS